MFHSLLFHQGIPHWWLISSQESIEEWDATLWPWCDLDQACDSVSVRQDILSVFIHPLNTYNL